MKKTSSKDLPPIGKPYRVILLTQDEIYASRFKKEGAAKNLHVLVAPNLRALARAPLSTFDLVVFNYDLEDNDNVTGIQVAEYLKKKHPRLDVVMVNGLSGVWQDPRAHCPNVVALISQWSGPDDCLRTILTHLRRGEEASEARSPVPVLTLSPATALSRQVTHV